MKRRALLRAGAPLFAGAVIGITARSADTFIYAKARRI